MTDNNAKQIETLVRAIVRTEASGAQKGNQAEPAALVRKDAVPSSIVKAKDKIQPTKLEEGGGIKSPLTQLGAFEVYEPALHTDSTGILTFVYMPLKTATFKTADVIPKEVKFIFTDVPRAP